MTETMVVTFNVTLPSCISNISLLIMLLTESLWRDRLLTERLVVRAHPGTSAFTNRSWLTKTYCRVYVLVCYQKYF